MLPSRVSWWNQCTCIIVFYLFSPYFLPFLDPLAREQRRHSRACGDWSSMCAASDSHLFGFIRRGNAVRKPTLHRTIQATLDAKVQIGCEVPRPETQQEGNRNTEEGDRCCTEWDRYCVSRLILMWSLKWSFVKFHMTEEGAAQFIVGLLSLVSTYMRFLFFPKWTLIEHEEKQFDTSNNY